MEIKNLIWTNDRCGEDETQWRKDWVEHCEANDMQEYIDSDDHFYQWQHESLERFLGDERINLNIQLPHPIIAIADLGLWLGRQRGYKLVDSGNIKDILESECDYVTWYSDGENVCYKGVHHDGTNYCTYRTFTEVETENGLDVVEFVTNAIYDNHPQVEEILEKYTRSILPEVANVYGWEVEQDGE